ncbi:methylenetetrahydrofolate reductase [Amycolatopsis sp. NPDC051903]|uniref:methylenetetrahydrofolate reductase n=1 Tax=Amycolatopsis sp. NPDC051903 TaxID=3363936 RepID=UPI003796F5C8
MTTQQEVAGSQRRRPSPAELVRTMSYEVMPFRGTEQAVLEHVPTTVPLTVTVTEAKGLEPTLDLTERLLRHGYQVAPHLPARQFTDRGHVAGVVARLSEAGVRSVFVIGGDAPKPAGEFADAYALLRTMADVGHPFTEVGIGGYPEGHATISAAALDEALRAKAPLATRIITQICFDAAVTGAWSAGIAASGIDLPVHIGLPGPVNRQKLVRISAGIGLGQSARFLRKQQNLVWRLLLPHGYEPTKLALRLAAEAPRGGIIGGLHVFTFNELAKTEAWRRELLARLDAKDVRA